MAAVGAFYSIYDGQIEPVKRRLRLCIHEYDDAVAHDKQALLHRISHRLFKKEGAVRTDIDLFLQADQPIWTYSRMFVSLLECALLPVVERRIEAAHAAVHRIGRAAFGAGLPCVCAAIRTERNLDLLARSAAFMGLACREWRSRTLTDKVLHLRYTREVLKSKSIDEKIRMVYQTGIAQEFEPCLESRANIELFRIATTDTRIQLPRIPEENWQCNVFLKSIMDAGAFIALPRDLFQMCLLRPPHVPEFPAHFKPVDLAVATSLVALEESRFDDGTHRVFQVIREFPGNRVCMQCHHVADDRRWHMNVHMWTPQDYDPSHPNRIVACSDNTQFSLCTLDMRPLVIHIMRTLSEGMRFRVKASTTAPALRPLDPALCANTTNALPIADIATNTGVDVIVPAQPRFAMVDMDEQDALLNALTTAEAFTTTGRTLHTSDASLQDVSDLVISELADRGAVRVTRDGDTVSLALVPASINWQLIHGLDEPVPLARCTTSRTNLHKTKLELIIALECDGWQVATGVIAPYERGRPQLFSRSLSKATAYFACLCSASEVLDKGVPRIVHTKTALYYRSLLHLDADALGRILPALEDMQEAALKKALTDFGEDPTTLDPEPIDDVVQFLLPVQGDVVAPVALPPPRQQNLWNRCKASAPGFESIKVYFDHPTTSGGNQKGYAVCAKCKVTRWKVCHETRQRYCATMLAWQLACEASGGRPELHRPWLPLEASLQTCMDNITLEDF